MRGFREDAGFARELDRQDPLRKLRERFHIPRGRGGKPVVYLCGNSLGLQPKAAARYLEEERSAWERSGVHGHFTAETPWFSYHEVFRKPLARLVGAKPEEVVAMNSLTVNLQLLLVSFYRPVGHRDRILIEDPAFPSDRYAAQTQLLLHGRDPKEALVLVKPRPGEHTLRDEDLEAAIEREGPHLALVLLGGVNFFTGQVFDMRRAAAACRKAGVVLLLDLAHAVGNVPLKLHEWGADCAVWCGYKYLNAGPGAVGGCFVHERHGKDLSIPRLGGWWGNDPKTRFEMRADFAPKPGADGWQLSNPPIFAMAPLRASLDLFEEAGMPALRAKSRRMAAYLDLLLKRLPSRAIERITPLETGSRGCQVSLLVRDRARARFKALERRGIVCDFREPNVIRAAPVPLYNTFSDIHAFVEALRAL